MKFLLVTCLFVVLTTAASAQKKPSEDDALLKPNDPAYADAVKFAEDLELAGIHVGKIFSSKLNGFFRGVERAAYYRTDKGAIEAIFFSDDGAEKIQVTESKDGAAYVYSFSGQPQPNPPGDTFNSNKPIYFLTHGNAFVVIWGDKELFAALKAGLNSN